MPSRCPAMALVWGCSKFSGQERNNQSSKPTRVPACTDAASSRKIAAVSGIKVDAVASRVISYYMLRGRHQSLATHGIRGGLAGPDISVPNFCEPICKLVRVQYIITNHNYAALREQRGDATNPAVGIEQSACLPFQTLHRRYRYCAHA